MSKLGRGLEALLPGSFTIRKVKEPQEQQNLNSGIFEVELEKIQVNPYQPRKNFDEVKLQELADSIRKYGILQPLLVTKLLNGKFELLVGERRFHAAKISGLKKVPVMIKEVDMGKKLELALVENIQRQDLNPIEQALAFKRLSLEFDLTQEEIAKKVGKSRSDVANIMRLLTLPQEIQKAIFVEKITLGHAKAILGLEDNKRQLEMFNQIMQNRMPIREVEEKVRQVKVKSHLRGGNKKSLEIMSFEEKLRNALGTKVSIKKRGEKGYILVDFYSQEELLGLVEKISGEKE